VVCFTGSTGTTTHSSRPTNPANPTKTAINRGIRCDR